VSEIEFKLSLVGKAGVVARSNQFYGLKKSSCVTADLFRNEHEDTVDADAIYDPTNFIEAVGIKVAFENRQQLFLSDLKGQFYRLEQNGSSRASCCVDENEAVACLNAAKLRGCTVTISSYGNF
jgi:hypothetical protein